MKITEYPSIKTFTADNVLLTEEYDNTKTQIIPITYASSTILDTKGRGADDIYGNISMYANTHRTLYRGKNLGTTLSEDQKYNIKNGFFNDLWLGDYWVINDIKWLIVDFDYWFNTNNVNGSPFAQHHLVIMPEKSLYTAKINSTTTSEGGYVGSEMYKSNLENAKTIINNAFGDAVLTHKLYLCNAFSNGMPTGGAWYDSIVDLPNEEMIYGHRHYGISNVANSYPNNFNICITQLALFMVCPELMVGADHMDYWLRDPTSPQAFAFVSGSGFGMSYWTDVTSDKGVRPAFAIGG